MADDAKRPADSQDKECVSKSCNPGYDLSRSLQEATKADLERGYTKGK